MPYVFGSDYSGVSSARANADQMNIGVQQAEAARRDQAARDYANQLARQQEAQIQQETARQANLFNFRMQQQGRQDSLAANAEKTATKGYQFGVQEARANDQFNRGLEFQKQDRRAQLDEQAGSQDYNEAFSETANGNIRDASQLPSRFPKLTPVEVLKLTDKIAARNLIDQQQYDALLAMANEATGFIKTKNPATAAIPAAHWWNSDKAAVPASQLDEDAAFALATNHRVVAKNLDKLSWDAASQRFVPAIAPPTGYVMPTKRPGFTLPTPPVAGTNAPVIAPPVASNFETRLSPPEEAAFQQWKQRYAPMDSGADYDLRGAFKAGLTPTASGHWPDTFKKPNHPTFSNQSIYASQAPQLAGSWNGETYIPPTASTGNTGWTPPPPMPVPNTTGATVTDYSNGGGNMPRPAGNARYVYDPVSRKLVPVTAPPPVVFRPAPPADFSTGMF